jgi:Uma2 family endonuclease
MGIPRIDTGPMTVEEFYAFTDARPDEEKWELIDGEPILGASPSDFGAFVSRTSRPEPDVMILPKPPERGALPRRDTTEAIALFDVMSPSTANRDLKWKRIAYTSLPALTHYVVVAQDTVDIVVFAWDSGFAEKRYRSMDDTIAFPTLGIGLAVSEIYWDVGLG